MSSRTLPPAAAVSLADHPAVRRRDWLTIALVATAHAVSHFFQLVIPSLYVSLGAAFDLDFARLGLLVSVFYVTSGLGQASSGFVVDRLGARPVLWFGLGSFVVSGVLMAAANGYAMLLLAAFIAGAGNSVFHPVDFAIFNHRVSQRRLGHAFSTHGLTGNLGWALTPVFITTLTLLFNWRVAALGAAMVAGVALVLTLLGRRLLVEPERDAHGDAAAAQRAAAAGAQADGRGDASAAHPAPAADAVPSGILDTVLMLLRRPALWGAFMFFAFSSLGLSAVQNYTIPLLGERYGLSHVAASSALSGYMIASAFGMMLGGFLVSSTPRTERVVAGSLVTAGLTLALLAMGAVPAALAVPVVGLAGLCAGLAGPSRDMLIRRVAPRGAPRAVYGRGGAGWGAGRAGPARAMLSRRVAPRGATGSVYGLVYSGMDVGAAMGPLIFGLMLDAGFGHGPWLGAAAAFVLAAVLASLIGRSVAGKR